MTAKLHHTVLPIDAMAATSAATGYPASNVMNVSVGKPWRSTSVASNNLDIDLGTTRTAPVIGIQGPNAASCTLSYGAAAYTTTSAGTQTLAQDRHGRRKHTLALAGSVRYIRLVFGAAAPDDALDYFEVGAIHVFASTLSLPDEPLTGAELSARYPQTAIELANGADITLERGVPRQRIALRFRSLRTVDIEQAVRLARKGACWLDLDVAANRELQWPVRHLEGEQSRTLSRAAQDEASITLREVA